MKKFDDNLPKRKFDNLQFVDAVSLREKCRCAENPEVAFATHVLMEIPLQYEYIKKHIFPNYQGKNLNS